MDVTEPAEPTMTGRDSRIRDLAALMRGRGDGPGEGLTVEEARAAGFTLAEIEAYRDRAMVLAQSGTPVVLAPRRRRSAGDELVRQARAIRHRGSVEP
ncbi:hypothetical protein [Methylobacterium sp. NFXW15]|uniref:hypothetical protein n=1 Tax=Methylobacterium sp. NFXW15 TaxID=2819512 RepID=UPI003CF378F5